SKVYLPGSGLALPVGLGQRPHQRHSPKIYKSSLRRDTATASHPAAKPKPSFNGGLLVKAILTLAIDAGNIHDLASKRAEHLLNYRILFHRFAQILFRTPLGFCL